MGLRHSRRNGWRSTRWLLRTVGAGFGARCSLVTARRILVYLGRALLTAGVLVLLYVAFLLWGTGLHEARAQADLKRTFDAQLAAASTTTATVPPTTDRMTAASPTTTAPPVVAVKANIAPSIGDPVGRIEIPAIHIKKIVVQGVSLEQLDRAPGHYVQTPFPGQAGNASIAGHRTTYGGPFSNVNKLKPGDKIYVTTIQGRFTYAVQKVFIVKPDEVWVLKTATDHPNTLTLTACHPKKGLSHRIVVRAVLQGKPVPHLSGQDEQARHFRSTKLADGVTKASHRGAWMPMVLWGLLCAVIWALTWLASRTWRRRDRHALPRWLRAVLPYVVGVPVFGVSLFICFENLSQLLPAGL
jgi:sortase A